MNNRYKKLTILHSNDLHGDFSAEKIDDKLVGGVSCLAGYVNQTRELEDNCIYCIAGDMFRGSVIDSEYLGLSTIEIMNMLAPDVVTIGNHETDYGLAHLLFIEKCANFPIINANMHIKMNGQRIFNPYQVIEMDGMKILFIGITTEDVIANTKKEGIISTFINVDDAAKEVGKICNAFNAIDIDFTVLLTHIGYEEDKKLAQALDPAWGVDVIIGGHSHTLLKEATKVNDVLIVQAGSGTDQIGRFDILVDTDKNCVESYSWQTIEINNTTCPRDEKIEKLIQSLKEKTDLKYEKVITRLQRKLTHPKRHMQTQLGAFIGDTIKQGLGFEIFFETSGAVRKQELGPIVTYKDIVETCPFTDKIYQFLVDGEQLIKMWNYIYRDESWDDNAHTEFIQLSEGLQVKFSKSKKEVVEMSYHDKPINKEKLYICGCREYLINNLKNVFGIDEEDIIKHQKPRIICTNVQDIIVEILGDGNVQKAPNDDRLVFVD